MHFTFIIISVQVQSKVSFYFPVARNIVAFAQNGYDVVGIFFANIFYSKIIYAQRKSYRAPFVCPETWFYLALLVSFFVEPLFE